MIDLTLNILHKWILDLLVKWRPRVSMMRNMNSKMIGYHKKRIAEIGKNNVIDYTTDY